MKHLGPMFTLLAGVVLAAGIGAANFENKAGTTNTAATQNSANSVGTSPPNVVAPAPPQGKPPAKPAPPPNAPQPNATPSRADYSGHVDGATASVAVSVRDGHAIAYVCDGKKTEAWLKGNAADGKLDLRDAKGGDLAAKIDATTITGTVTADGKTWRFTAPMTTKPAGLYRANATVQGRSSKVGWIVQPDGTQVGILNTGEVLTAAPLLNPAAGTASVGGTTITAESISGLNGEGDF
jgi:hypothetical protein